MAVYLLHIERPTSTPDTTSAMPYHLKAYIAAHKTEHGTHLTKAVVAAGHKLTVVQVWMGGSRTLERELKNIKNIPLDTLTLGYLSWDD